MSDTSNVITVERTFPATGATRRIWQGSFANLIGGGVRALEHILLLPLFLYAWGDTIYGEWLIVFSTVSYLLFADVGMSNFVINRMLQRYASGDHAGYQRTFWSAWGLYRWIAIVLIPLLLLFAFFTPFTELLRMTHVSDFSFRMAVFMLGLSLLLSHLPGLLSGVYISTGQYARWGKILALQDILTVALVSTMLILGSGFIIIAAGYLFMSVLFFAFTYYDIRHRHPEIGFRNIREHIDKKLLQTFFLSGIIFLAIPFANFIKIQGSVLLAGSSFGGAFVAMFSVHRTLANIIPRGLSVLLPSLQHEMTATMERGNIQKVQDTHALFFKAILAISISIAAFLFVTGKIIITLWTSGKIVFHPVLWVLLLADAVVYNAWQLSSCFQIAANRYRLYALVRVVSALVGLFLAKLLMLRFGLVGVVTGFLLPEIFINFTLVPYVTLKMIQEPVWRLLKTVGVSIALLILQSLAIYTVAFAIAHPFLQIAVIGVVVFLIGFFFTFFLWFRDHERAIILSFCKIQL